MKPEESRIPIKHRHELDNAAPVVIHDPEANMNALERWLRHAMENPTQFWGVVAALVVVLAAVSFFTSGVSLSRAGSSDAWAKLEAAKTAEEREEVAKAYPNTPAERTALLQVATEFYMKGFSDLPSNKDQARVALLKALQTFQKIADTAPADSPQARSAALGVARTLEARNELDKALAQYEKVATNPAWKNSPEATEAAKLTAVLKKPEAVAFYKELYAYKPPVATLPPGGSTGLDLPLLPPSLTNPSVVPGASSIPIQLPDPSIVPPPPPSPTPLADPVPKVEVKVPTVETPKAEPPKAEAPKAAPAGLPDDPFAAPKK